MPEQTLKRMSMLECTDAITANPWAPVRCGSCGTVLRKPSDAACEVCEIVAETMEDARYERTTP